MKLKKIICTTLSLTLIGTLFVSSFSASAAGNHAFSVGTNYGLFDVNTSSDATNACDLYAIAGYTSNYSTEPTVSIMRGNFQDGTKRIQSDILFFSGHGNADSVVFNFKNKGGNYKTGVYSSGDWTSSSSGYGYVGLKGNMGSVKLITLAACNTASGTNNITRYAKDQGADAAVGWTTTVEASSHTKWLARYNDKLATGSTVYAAISYANSFSYSDNAAKNAYVYGNGNITIKRTKSVAYAAEEANLHEIATEKTLVANAKGIDINAVTTVLEKSVGNFDSTYFKPVIHQNAKDYYTVDYIQMVNGFETDSCITVLIQNNTIDKVIDNRLNINVKSPMLTSKSNTMPSDFSTEDIMLEARELTERAAWKTVKEQTGDFHFDVETGNLQYIVLTTYYFDGTDALGVDEYIKDII